MEIYRNQHQGLAILETIRRQGTQRTPPAEESSAPPPKPLNDRRIQPDRRRVQADFKGPDRRRRHSRRSPGLLHPQSRKPTSIEDRRGRMLSTQA